MGSISSRMYTKPPGFFFLAHVFLTIGFMTCEVHHGTQQDDAVGVCNTCNTQNGQVDTARASGCFTEAKGIKMRGLLLL